MEISNGIAGREQISGSRWSKDQVRAVLEKPKPILDLFSAPSLAFELINLSINPKTLISYESYWDEFLLFLRWEGKSLDSIISEEMLTDFVLWYAYTCRCSSVPTMLSAVRHFAAASNVSVVDISVRLKKIIKGVEKQAAEEKEELPKRDAFPIAALLKYLTSDIKKDFIYWRNAALISSGFRSMQRGSQLCNFLVGNVVMEEDGGMSLLVQESKTDQLGKGHWIKIEPVENSQTCPVRIMKSFLAKFHAESSKEDFLFFSMKRGSTTRRQMTVPAVSSVVKHVASIGGFKGRFASHSLRIGGASAAVAGGLSMAQVKSIGGWISDSVDIYLRNIEAAAQGASKKMGF